MEKFSILKFAQPQSLTKDYLKTPLLYSLEWKHITFVKNICDHSYPETVVKGGDVSLTDSVCD